MMTNKLQKDEDSKVVTRMLSIHSPKKRLKLKIVNQRGNVL